MEIKEIIKAWIKESLPVQFKTGKVTAVDKEQQSCTVVLMSGVELFEVSLRAILDDSDKGFIVYPKVQSDVVVAFLNGNENNAFIVQYSEITDIAIHANVIFNSDDNDNRVKKGMVWLSELVERLNTIENKVNDIVSWSSTHTHSGVTTGSGTSGMAPGITGSLTLTKESDLENTSIKH